MRIVILGIYFDTCFPGLIKIIFNKNATKLGLWVFILILALLAKRINVI